MSTSRKKAMKTVQMTLDEELVEAVDEAAARLETTRSAFTRQALREALRRHRTRMLEEQHRKGYQKHPVEKDKFSIPWDGHAWGDE